MKKISHAITGMCRVYSNNITTLQLHVPPPPPFANFVNESAKTLHVALTRHVNGISESVEEVRKCLETCDCKGMQELHAKTGDSHLMFALMSANLGVNRGSDKAKLCSAVLMREMMRSVQQNNSSSSSNGSNGSSRFTGDERAAITRTLLVCPNASLWTPLYAVMRYRDLQTLRIYTDYVDDAVEKKYVSPQDLKDLLLRKTKTGEKSPFHLLLEGYNTQTWFVQWYFKTFQSVVNAGLMGKEDYQDLLVRRNNESGLTPMKCLLNKYDKDPDEEDRAELLQMYFMMLDVAMKEKVVSVDDVKQVILMKTLKVGSHVSHIVSRQLPNSLQVFLEVLKKANTDGIVNNVELNNLLTCTRKANATLFHDALKAGKVHLEMFHTLVAFLDENYKEEIITRNTLSHLICAADVNGCTPLHTALASGSVELATSYLTLLSKSIEANIISLGEFSALVNRQTNSGFVPLMDAFRNAEMMDIYIDFLQDSMAKNILSMRDFRFMLLITNEAGFTTLNNLLKKGELETFRIYSKLISHCSEEKILSRLEIGRLLSEKNSDGFTPLHHAANSNDFDLLVEFLELLRLYFDAKGIYMMLMEKNKHGFLPRSLYDKSNADKINNYLSACREVFRKSAAESESSQGASPASPTEEGEVIK